jgi:hypothetical protein
MKMDLEQEKHSKYATFISMQQTVEQLIPSSSQLPSVL